MCRNLKDILKQVKLKPEDKITMGSKLCFTALADDMDNLDKKIDKLSGELNTAINNQNNMNSIILEKIEKVDGKIEKLNHNIFEDKTSEKAYMYENLRQMLFGSWKKTMIVLGILLFAGIGFFSVVDRILDKSKNVSEIVGSIKK